MKLNNLSIVICLTLSFISMAGNESGKGGHGLIINGKPYLVDLIEAGVEQNPYLDSRYFEHPALERVKGRLKLSLQEILGQEAQTALAAKLIEIYNHNNSLAHALLYSIGQLQWYGVSQELFNVWLENPAIEIPVEKLVQLAVRRGLVVRLNRDYLSQMDAMNNAALILHEALYALTSPEIVTYVESIESQEVKVALKEQNAERARNLTGFLFSKNIEDAERFKAAAFSYPNKKTAIALLGNSQSLKAGFSIFVRPDISTFECNTLNHEYAITRNESASAYAEKACPLVSESLYKSCLPVPSYETGSYSLEPKSYWDLNRKKQMYLDGNASFFATYKTDLFGITGGGYLSVNSRQECLNFAQKAHALAVPDLTNKSLFDE